MSHYDYQVSKQLVAEEPPFAALIMAAMRRADTINQFLLRRTWPDLWDELASRYNAPGGLIPGDAQFQAMHGPQTAEAMTPDPVRAVDLRKAADRHERGESPYPAGPTRDSIVQFLRTEADHVEHGRCTHLDHTEAAE